LACVLLLFLPRGKTRGRAMFLLLFTAVFLLGCGGTAATDPGTSKGTYTVVVTATASNGSAQDQASVNVPVTVQ
jgi:ABC-type glycerol-3-phosphate transport system substrate-binding protein